MANSSSVLSGPQKKQVASTLEHSAQFVTNTQLERMLSTERPKVQDEVIAINTKARHRALQIALLVPLLAAVLGLLNSLRMLKLPDPKPSADLEGLVGG
jgi:hypothetical protein